MLYIFRKLRASSKQWFKLYSISYNQENVLGLYHKLILPYLSFHYTDTYFIIFIWQICKI